MAAVYGRIALTVCLSLLLAGGGAAAFVDGDAAAAPVVLPPTIQVDALLQPLVARMLERSPTFRRQCRGIADARIVVAVHLTTAPRNSTTHAFTTLRRYSSGLMVAEVEVPAAAPLVQLIAHEFEHIAEFIEGVDLETLIVERPGEVHRRLDGAYETGRAIKAGRDAHLEVSSR